MKRRLNSCANSARKRRSRKRKAAAGFTLIELLVAMAVFMTIVAIAILNMMPALDLAKVARAVGDIHAIESDIALYNLTNGQLPNSLADIGRDYMVDPWGNPYAYLNHTNLKGNGLMRKDRFLVPLNSDYDLYSMGKDGQSAAPLTAKMSQDDVVRASDGNYVGLASDF